MIRTTMLERKETKPPKKKINLCQLHNKCSIRHSTWRHIYISFLPAT